MMIQIKHFSKSFSNHQVIKDLNIDFPDSGLVAILGPSGCGKTTLLNVISGIDQNIDGEIIFDGLNLTTASKQEILNYRLHKLGYVFQSFNLIPLETGERNVSLVLDSSTNISRTFRKRKIRRLFKIFNIEHLRKQKVINMSGGEKQRIAILRAIVNSPKVVLCDEPTGALDERNANEIMKILRQISVNSLVIVVSHDEQLINKYADRIVYMKDGKVINQKSNKLQKAILSPIENSGKKLKKAHIPFMFKSRYSIGKMKSKKVRTIISNLMMSLSLTGIGASFLLSNLVTTRINKAFSDLTNGNQIVMRTKNEALNTYGDIFSAPEREVEKIANKYKEDIKGVGVSYLVNFEDFFKDRNEVYFIADGKRYLLNNYSARNFNEYKWYERSFPTYPYSVNLELDDVVLGMTYEDMSNLCFEFKIQRSFNALGQFLSKASCQLNLVVENDDWIYDDEQIFNVIGVIQTSTPLLYHSNHLWNEYVFEEHMRIPSIEGGEQYAVWEMTKNYFLESNSSIEELQNKLFFDEDYHDYVFQKTNHDFDNILCNSTVNCQENRLYVYYSDVNGIRTSDVEYLTNFYSELSKFYFTSEYGYSSYASNLLNGFSKNFYVSLDESKIDDAIDADTSLSKKEDVTIDLPDGICGGNYLQSLDGAIKFSTQLENIYQGRKPNNNSEIVVSTGLAKKLSDSNVLGQRLLFASVKNESVNINNQIEKKYGKTSAVIVGLVDEEKDYLYHDNLWTISFFRDKLEINPFTLIPDGVVFELENDVDTTKVISNIQRMFPLYDISSPQSEVLSSVGNVLDYAKAILLAFSVISLIISFLFLGTMVLLSINESKDEIKMFNYLGIGGGQVRSLFRNQTFLRCMIAFLISSIELIAIENILTLVLNKTLHVSTFTFSITLFSLFIVLICATIVPLIITQLILLVVSKRKKIE